jgi:hypothetical protein
MPQRITYLFDRGTAVADKRDHVSLYTPQGKVSIQSKSGVECLTPYSTRTLKLAISLFYSQNSLFHFKTKP